MLIYYGCCDFTINVIDMLMLLATIALSITALYLSKRFENNDIIKDITISDLKDLCNIYKNNSTLLNSFNTKDQESLTKEIIFNFNKADSLIDQINSQFKESFPKMLNKEETTSHLEKITSPYWKWLTGGELMNDNFNITPKYIKEHESNLNKVIGELKIIIHRLVKIA